MTIYDHKSARSMLLDFRETAPAALDAQMFESNPRSSLYVLAPLSTSLHLFAFASSSM